MKEKFGFIFSIRFWKIVVIVTLETLIALGIIDTEVAVAIAHGLATISGLSVTIRTVDRFSENVGK